MDTEVLERTDIWTSPWTSRRGTSGAAPEAKRSSHERVIERHDPCRAYIASHGKEGRPIPGFRFIGEAALQGPYTEMQLPLAVKGSRFQPSQRSFSPRPAILAMRSSSLGHVYRVMIGLTRTRSWDSRT